MKTLEIRKLAFVISALMLVSLAQIAIALPEYSNQDRSLAIMSNVFDLDLSKYSKVLNGSSDHFNSAFGPDVNQESILYTLVAGASRISVDLNFVGDSFWYCNLQIEGKPIYTQTESANVLDQSKNLLQRYKTYVAQYSRQDTSYISAMASTLNSVSELKSISATEGNTKLNISITATRVSNIPMQTLKWFYTENGIDVPKKAVTFTYTDGVLTSISDTWNLYSLGSLNSIPEVEVLSIAWAQAQSLTLRFISENGSTYEVKPDLSNVTTEVKFSMQTRNNTQILYPSWIVTYYFAKPYGQNYGIEVGIWGDTKQVVFCNPLVILGGSGIGSEPSGISTSPSQTSPNTDGTQDSRPDISDQSIDSNADSSLNNYFIAITAALGIASLAIVCIYIKKKSK